MENSEIEGIIAQKPEGLICPNENAGFIFAASSQVPCVMGSWVVNQLSSIATYSAQMNRFITQFEFTSQPCSELQCPVRKALLAYLDDQVADLKPPEDLFKS